MHCNIYFNGFPIQLAEKVYFCTLSKSLFILIQFEIKLIKASNMIRKKNKKHLVIIKNYLIFHLNKFISF